MSQRKKKKKQPQLGPHATPTQAYDPNQALYSQPNQPGQPNQQPNNNQQGTHGQGV